MKKLPGIFNDVIGPVMRGPSSSHTAASWRIARIAVQILNEPLKRALVEFDKDGAWAPNYREQGTTIGIDGGLLELDIIDERMKNPEGYIREKNIKIEYQISSFPTDHANTIRITLWGLLKEKVKVVAVSSGGGSFEVRSVNGFNVRMKGDLFEIIAISRKGSDISENLKKNIPVGVELLCQQNNGICFYELRSSLPFSSALIAYLQGNRDILNMATINPIMPVVSGRESKLPFHSVSSAIKYADEINADLGELGMIYEKCISGMTEKELILKMEEIIQIVHGSIAVGLRGTYYKDRIIQQQSHLIVEAEKEGKIREFDINRIISNVTALMESKSAMEVIVAIPTAGSCGVVGGTLFAVSEHIGSSREELLKAYYAAGIVGAYFAQGPGFSAEEYGCQVECGAASGMAAAGVVQLIGGSAVQSLGAASMAIQNMIGLVCDPVADRVEVPCLGKNISASVNAYSSAIMSLAGFDPVIPFEQVIQAVSSVGKIMPTCLKCTGRGGLALTDTSAILKAKLKERTK